MTNLPTLKEAAEGATPRTDAVFAAMAKLGPGSMVAIPEGYPPCDPWQLARQLERSLTACQAELERAREDAGRYLWLRDNAEGSFHMKAILPFVAATGVTSQEYETEHQLWGKMAAQYLDAAIDAAIAAQKGG